MFRTKHIIVEAHQHEQGKPIPAAVAKTCHDHPAAVKLNPGEACQGNVYTVAYTNNGIVTVREGDWLVRHPQLGLLCYGNEQFWGLIEQI